MKVICGSCGVNLKARDELAGKTAKCPKCGSAVEVPTARPRPTKGNVPRATERQKEYATELGIDFSPDIDRRAISELIDVAVQKRDDERYDKLEELSDRESQAWKEMRESVLEEIDEEDCRLSRAQPSQMIEELSNRGRCSVLITFDFDDVSDFGDLTGAHFQVQFSDDMEKSDMQSILMGLGLQMAANLGKTTD